MTNEKIMLIVGRSTTTSKVSKKYDGKFENKRS